MQIGTSDPQGKDMKQSTSGVTRSKVKITGGHPARVRFGGLAEALFSTP